MLNNFYSFLNFPTKLDFIKSSNDKYIERISKYFDINLIKQNPDLSHIKGDFSYLILEGKFNDLELVINNMNDNIYLKYVFALSNVAFYIPEKELTLNDIKGFSLMDYIIVPTLETKNYLETKIPNIKNIYFIPFNIDISPKRHKNKVALCISEKDLSNKKINEYLKMKDIDIFTDHDIKNLNNHNLRDRLSLYKNINDYYLIIDFYNDFLASIIQKKALINKRLYIGKYTKYSNIQALIDLDNSLDEKMLMAEEQIKEYSLTLENMYSDRWIHKEFLELFEALIDKTKKRETLLENNSENLNYKFKLNQILEQIIDVDKYLISDQENFDLVKKKQLIF